MLGEQVGGDVDGVRYDSPTLMGFKVSASWGEDDHWAAALRFANEFGDFRVAAAVGYDVKTDLAANYPRRRKPWRKYRSDAYTNRSLG